MEGGNDADGSDDLPEKIAKRLFPIIAQQQSCAKHLSRLLAERQEPLTEKLLRDIQQDAIALTMREASHP